MTVCTSVKGDKGNYIGDPTEVALKTCVDAAGYGVDFLRLAELPFTSERKMMTVAADVGGERLSFTKGAPDVLIHRCTHYLTSSGVREFTSADKKAVLNENDIMSDDALRVLGFAYKSYGGKIDEEGLIFIGLCGMTDGLKEGAGAAVEECRGAGVSTVMITGDHVRTALSIAKKLNIASNESEVMTGDRKSVV